MIHKAESGAAEKTVLDFKETERTTLDVKLNQGPQLKITNN